MEPRIAVLAPHVIDQIAAGEVIERPASVVKELVDNAIDAGATAIVIEVAGGGRSLVRVTDDGCGMSAQSAVLSLERHATSKLREVDDLWGIASMGFRGEALPSIASVSRMTLTTRRAGDDAATRLVVEAGRLASVTEVGAAVGTTVEVTDLLHNLPARLKFLKGEATEASHVTDLVAKVAMAYPRLHIKLRHNGRTALDAPPDRDGFARAQALLGPRIAARMAPVNGEESGVRVAAYLGAPELAQATARGVQLFVGRRPVRDRGLLHALAMGYGELIPRGRYPVAVVLVDVPAGLVDVNVHPQKLEVRFSDAASVAAAVRHIVQAGVHAAGWRSEAGGAGPVQMLASVAPPVLPFDGPAATPLSERAVAQMKSRQVPLGFSAADVTAPSRQLSLITAQPATSQRAPAAPAGPGAVSAGPAGPGAPAAGPARPTSVAAEPSLFAAASPAGAPDRAGGRPGEPPGAASAGSPARSSAAARDWARALREQNRASRVEEPRATWDDGSSSAALVAGAAAGAALESAGGALDAWQFDPQSVAEVSAGAEAAMPEAQPGTPSFDPGALALDPGAPPLEPGATPSSSVAADTTASLVSSAFEARPPASRGAHGFFAQLRYLGQLDLTYLVCESDGELVLVDQHAAHERVELARLRDRQHNAVDGGDARVAIQKLLFPVAFDATPTQIALAVRVGDVLAQVGFEVEPFGKATLAVKAVPANLRHGDPAELLRSLLQRWGEDGAPSEAERVDSLLGEIACHSVVRAGDRLGPSEAETLLRSLDGVDLSQPAPHGRAVLLRLPLAEIGRRFGR